MRRRSRAVLAGLVLFAAGAIAADPSTMVASHSSSSSNWRRHAAYPREFGVAGVIAGSHAGRIIAAGGANFPDRPPWDGGKKVTHADIHVYDPARDVWSPAGEMPEPRGYAAMVSLPEGILALGGENAARVFDDSLWLTWQNDKVKVTPGPRLPVAMTSAAAVHVGRTVYLSAGYTAGTPRLTQSGFWRIRIDEAEPRWEALPPPPGPARAQAVMATVDGKIYLLSGIEIARAADGRSQVRYLTDAYRFDPGSMSWTTLPPLPRSAIAAPSPAPVAEDPARIFILGGVDGRLVGKQPRDTRVPGDIIFFDVGDGVWRASPEVWPEPVVTAPAVALGGRYFFISGEIMSGVRTPQVWSWIAPFLSRSEASK